MRKMIFVLIFGLIIISLFGCIAQQQKAKADGEIIKQQPKTDISKTNSLSIPKKDSTAIEIAAEVIRNQNQTNQTNQTKFATSTFDPRSVGRPNQRVKAQPPPCCSHPYYHSIHFATSSDGRNWQAEPQTVRDKAGVPEYFILDDGTHMIYFVDGEYDTLGCIESSDGKTFREAECQIYNFTLKKIWDPAVARVDDGTYRMFFFSPEFKPGFDPQQSSNKIYSAISKDGKSWLVEPGIRFEDNGITDPSVIKNERSGWLMFVSRGEDVVQAESADGLTFVKKQELRVGGGVPYVARIENLYFLYFCARSMISYVTSENGELWNQKGLRTGLNAAYQEIICDPSVVRLSDGKYRMVYKKQKIP